MIVPFALPPSSPGSCSRCCARSSPLDWLGRRFTVVTLAASLLGQTFAALPAPAQSTPYCQQTPETIARKETLRQVALQGNRDASKRYRALIAQQSDRLRQCRNRTWPQKQAIWIRLYPCDAQPGALDAVLDRIVNRGYNQVYVEAFYNGRVLLPVNNNPTVWTPVLSGSRADNVDLLAQAIQKGHERGLKVHAWLFGMNFGSDYVRRSDRQQALARNGLGQTSLTANTIAGLSIDLGLGNPNEAFVDPYSLQARQDYARLVQAIAKRRPDGMLFDYIRYPRGYGSASVASRVQDLWVYGDASRQMLLQRALNYKGMELIQRFLNRGYITGSDLTDISALYPQEKEPLWQGMSATSVNLPINKRVTLLQSQLWQLAVAHAFQGVLDFVTNASSSVQQQKISAGAVFFPEGNLTVGQGFDSRLQPWNRFPTSIAWHPMAYGVCGNASCIVAQVQRVLRQAPAGTRVEPVLAGIWQKSVSNRPPLEVQMQALYRAAPQIKSVSHFAYSWQEPGSDRDRKYCQPR